MKLKDMTPEQRAETVTKAVSDLQAWFDKPEVKKAHTDALNERRCACRTRDGILCERTLTAAGHCPSHGWNEGR